MQKNNSYLLFGKRTIVFLLIIIFFDIIIGKTIEHFYFKVKYGQTVRINYAITKATENVIIFGSSHASHHYQSATLEDSLRLSTYNTGIDGESILYHYCVLGAILSRAKPKIVILDLDLDEFVKNKKAYNVLYLLLPYYNKYEEMQPIINLRSNYESVKAVSNLYRYNSLLLPVILNNAMYRRDDSHKGYTPLYGTLNVKNIDFSQRDTTSELDMIKINIFRSFIQKAKSSHSDVFVFVSPAFQKDKKNTSTIEIAAKICSEEKAFFINHNASGFFNNSIEYFKDISHLNDQGAKIYTKQVFLEIQTLLSTRQ